MPALGGSTRDSEVRWGVRLSADTEGGKLRDQPKERAKSARVHSERPPGGLRVNLGKHWLEKQDAVLGKGLSYLDLPIWQPSVCFSRKIPENVIQKVA